MTMEKQMTIPAATPDPLRIPSSLRFATEQAKREFLHPGQLCVSSGASTITTIVGSCVAVCLWNPMLRTGGMSHHILAEWDGTGEKSCRYGDIAVETLVKKMLEVGSYVRNLQAHVFGGACMFEAFRSREHHLGQANVEVAQTILAKHGVPILTLQTGGIRGRKITFELTYGTFTVKEI
jgi:chemotaxis protein CheD